MVRAHDFVVERHKLAIHTDRGREAGGEVDVAGLPLDGGMENLVDVNPFQRLDRVASSHDGHSIQDGVAILLNLGFRQVLRNENGNILAALGVFQIQRHGRL
jgi:hypothetical protein